MGILTILCMLGIVTFFKNSHNNYWWRYIYLFGGGYVLFDLFSIAANLTFWHELLINMYDIYSQYWNILWGGFIVLGAGVFLLGIELIIKKYYYN